MAVSDGVSIADEVRAAIAAYARALDDGRTEVVVDLFHPDGVVDIAGVGIFAGHEAIRGAYSGFTPRHPQLHLVSNTLVTYGIDDVVTATSDLVFLACGRSGWAVRAVGRYDDVLSHRDGAWRFDRRTATFRDRAPAETGDAVGQGAPQAGGG